MKTNNINQQIHNLDFHEQHESLNSISATSAQNDHQTNKMVNKPRGNRKLQRYRRKLRKQGLHSDAIANLISTWVNTDPSENYRVIKEHTQTATTTTTTTTTINDSLSQISLDQSLLVEKQKIPPQNNKNKKMTKYFNHSLHINATNSSSLSTTIMKNVFIQIDNPIKLEAIPDEIFCQMLSTASGDTNPFDDYYLNEKEKIAFVRHYTSLISRLSYIKLLQQQWNYYYHIGITRNIWTGRISKHAAEKNSICYTYGRAKKIVQQRRVQIEKQLEEIHHTIQLFENEILLKLEQHTACSSELKILLSNMTTFVQKHQQQLRDEFEYKREILILDATDHHFVQNFFHLQPNKSQVSSARRIWQATAQQILLEEQITIMNHRLTSLSLSTTTTTIDLFHRVLDDIDKKLIESLGILNQNASNLCSSVAFENLNQLKKQIILQGVITAQAMLQPILQLVDDKQHKFFFKKNGNEYTSRNEDNMVNAIETRRLHMIERGKYITQHKLLTSFKPIPYFQDIIK